MSFLKIKKIAVAPNEVRDFRLTFKGETKDKILDLWQEYIVIGLDWWVNNRGENSIDISIDQQPAVLIGASCNHGESNMKFSHVKIEVGAGAEVYDLVLRGVCR